MKTLYRRVIRPLWREWLRPLAFAAAVVFPLKSSLAEWNYVPSASMVPSLLPGDLVWVNKLAYDLKVPFTTWHLATWGDPQRGDVAVFDSPADGTRLVKRVIGLPGDLIELRGDRLYVNGAALNYAAPPPGLVDPDLDGGAWFAEENLRGRGHPVMIQPRRPALRTFGPIRVPAGCYFMMGDNRDDSYDSRFYGCVPRRAILGRSSVVLGSVDLHHWLRPRTERFLRAIP